MSSVLAYPKNGGAFLMQRITELHGSVADLIDELVKRDQELAKLRHENSGLNRKITELKTASECN